MSGNALGLYIHIPFCRSKCDYCDFYSLAGREDAMDAYLEALSVHLFWAAKTVRSRQVDTVYFGGGTPSFFGEKRLRQLIYLIRRRFSLTRNAEITVEANPDSVDRAAFSRLRRAGVNRISLGMQCADDRLLAAIHRPHTFAQTVAAVAMLREAKYKNISLDLIYGLPGQSLASWQDTLRKATALFPDHISCYGLKV